MDKLVNTFIQTVNAFDVEGALALFASPMSLGKKRCQEDILKLFNTAALFLPNGLTEVCSCSYRAIAVPGLLSAIMLTS